MEINIAAPQYEELIPFNQRIEIEINRGHGEIATNATS